MTSIVSVSMFGGGAKCSEDTKAEDGNIGLENNFYTKIIQKNHS